MTGDIKQGTSNKSEDSDIEFVDDEVIEQMDHQFTEELKIEEEYIHEQEDLQTDATFVFRHPAPVFVLKQTPSN